MVLPKKRPKRLRPHKPPIALTNTKTTAESVDTQPAIEQYKPETIEDINFLMDHLTKAISHLNFHQNRSLHLLKLPQEIQDIIFDFAYPAIDHFKVITRTQWSEREWEKRRARGKSYARQPFTTPTVSSFLISKNFFTSAAKAFVSNQTLTHSHASILLRTPRCTLITTFVRKTILSLMDLMLLSANKKLPPTLKHIAVQVRSLDFNDCVGPKFAWEEVFSDSDLRAIIKHYKLDGISGLKEFQLLPDKNHYAKSQDEEKYWTFNIRILEGYIRMRVTKPNPYTKVTTYNVEDFKALLDQKGDQVIELMAFLKMKDRLMSR